MRDIEFTEVENTKFTAINITVPSSLVLLAKVGWRQVSDLESEEGNIM